MYPAIETGHCAITQIQRSSQMYEVPQVKLPRPGARGSSQIPTALKWFLVKERGHWSVVMVLMLRAYRPITS